MRTWRAARRALAAGTVLACMLTEAAAAEPVSSPALQEQVRQADLAFAAALEARDRQAFAALIADDAVFFGGAKTHRGPEEILEAWSVYFQPDGPSLTWRPEKVEVNERRGMATSTGPYTLTTPATASSEARELHGQYFSVWTLDPDAGWQVLFDTGTAPEE